MSQTAFLPALLALSLAVCFVGASRPAPGAEEAPAQPPALETISGSPTCLSPAEEELVTQINEYRKAHRLNPLV